MDTKKLRQKILDLAIHGKLVPQDPNDEPASVLLERIREEKERLIKEGKIKRSKQTASSDLSSDDVPFDLPEGWCVSTLREVFNLQAGKNVSANDIHEFSSNTPYPCYGGNGIRGYVREFNCDGQFPIIGRQGALCGNINFAQGKFYATEHAVVVTCFADTDVLWSRYILEAMHLNQYATATAQPGLSVATINEVQILLPPYKEQQRIASAVEQWMSVIDVLENNEEDLRQSIDKAKSKILDLAIRGKLVPQDSNDEPASDLLKRLGISPDNCPCEDLPNGWENCRIEQIAQVSMGQSPESVSVNSVEGLEFHQGKLAFGDIYLNYSEVYTTQVTKIAPAYSVVLCVRAPVGIPNITERKICIGRGLCAISSQVLSNKYLYYSLKTKQSYFESNATGSTFMAISGSIIKDTPICVPPLAEQHRIVAKIEQLYSQLDEIESSLQ